MALGYISFFAPVRKCATKDKLFPIYLSLFIVI